MRICFNNNEVNELIDLLVHGLNNEGFEMDQNTKISILGKLQKELKKTTPVSKKKAVAKARATRSKKIKNVLENTINLMRLENKNITLYSLHKESGISYMTVKRYKEYISLLCPLV